MHFNWFFLAKANFKVCIEAQKISVAIFFPCQSLLLSTSVLNDMVGNFCGSNFLWFGELRGFCGFIFSWRAYSNYIVV